MKTSKKITANTLLEKRLKLSYEKSWGGLFPRLNPEIKISSFFGIIALFISINLIHQKAEAWMVITSGCVFISFGIFGCFKVYKRSVYQKAPLDQTHIKYIIETLKQEVDEIKNPKGIELSFESLVLSLIQKNEIFNKIEDEIKSITDESQEEDDLPGLKEVFEKTKDEILNLESEVSGRREIFEPIETEIKQLEIFFHGDGVKKVKSLVTPT